MQSFRGFRFLAELNNHIIYMCVCSCYLSNYTIFLWTCNSYDVDESLQKLISREDFYAMGLQAHGDACETAHAVMQ